MTLRSVKNKLLLFVGGAWLVFLLLAMATDYILHPLKGAIILVLTTVYILWSERRQKRDPAQLFMNRLGAASRAGILTFATFEAVKAHFEAAFARGEKERTEFILNDEPWECINCEIPTFRRIRKATMERPAPCPLKLPVIA